MEILGVVHDKKFLERIIRHIDAKYPDGVDSLMVELRSESDVKISDNSFFSDLVVTYGERGTEIIYGDINLKSSILEKIPFFGERYIELWVLFDAFTKRVRCKGMAEVAKERDPELMVVGRRHADYLKEKFPNAEYTAVVLSIQSYNPLDHVANYLVMKTYGTPNNADNFILLADY